VTTDFTDFTDKKDRFPIRDIREIRGQRIFRGWPCLWHSNHGPNPAFIALAKCDETAKTKESEKK